MKMLMHYLFMLKHCQFEFHFVLDKLSSDHLKYIRIWAVADNHSEGYFFVRV